MGRAKTEWKKMNGKNEYIICKTYFNGNSMV